MQTINLYLGAHKTATTHLTGILAANRDTLRAANITLSTPSEVRQDWLPAFFRTVEAHRKGRPMPEDAVRFVRSFRPASGDWILSEENVIGVPSELKSAGGIYRFGEARLATLRALFPDARLRLFFSIRSYDTFYRSMYSEIVRNAGYLPFETFYAPKLFEDRSWLETLSRFADVIPAEDIVLWKFEDFRNVMPEILKRITNGLDPAVLAERYKPEATRPSLSQKTLAILADLAPAIGRKTALELTEKINHHYAVADGHAPFQPFDDTTVSRMQALYRQHLDALKARYPTMAFVEPSAAQMTSA